MRIVCSNCGQLMDAPDHMAGQVVSCTRCRMNLQVPMPTAGAQQAASAPGTRPNLGVNVPTTPQPAAVRHYGRGVGITFGILLLLVTFVPTQIRPPSPAVAPGTAGTSIAIAWPWEAAQKATVDQTHEWVKFLLPAIAGVLAILGACLPSPGRGLLLWLAGLGLLLYEFLYGIFRTLAAGLPVALEGYLFLAVPPLVYMVVGGHGTAMRRAGKIGSRLAAGLPTLLALGAFGVLLAVVLPQQGQSMEMITRTLAVSARVPITASIGNPVWVDTVLKILAWAGMGLLGLSLLLGLINLFTGSRGAGVGGYTLGLLGILALMANVVVDPVVPLIQNVQVVVKMDYLCGFGKTVHDLVPLLFGIALVTCGWGSMCKRDVPPAPRAAQ
jgi:hypothetical protein